MCVCMHNEMYMHISPLSYLCTLVLLGTIGYLLYIKSVHVERELVFSVEENKNPENRK